VIPAVTLGDLARRQLVAAIRAVCCTALAVGTAISAEAQAPFEGIITYRTRTPSEMVASGVAGGIVQTTKGENVRLDLSGGFSTSFIIKNVDPRELIMLMPAQRAFMRITARQAEQMAANFPHPESAPPDLGSTPPADPSMPRLVVVPTDRVDTVAGVTCSVYHTVTVTSDGSHEGEICAAVDVGLPGREIEGSSLATFVRSPGTSRTPNVAQLTKVLGPLREILRITSKEGDSLVVRLEATTITRQRVSDDVFEPPPDYRELRMPLGPWSPPERKRDSGAH
jgi:hypothetical protein